MQKYLGWLNTEIMESKSFTCGHCGKSLASDKGYLHDDYRFRIYICHFCVKPTSFLLGKQTPGQVFGEEVNDISDAGILNLYNEARRCMSCDAYTASVLCCRKLLMNIAVSKGAKVGLKFIEYIEFLSDKNYVPPDGKDWVEHIRTKGNEANHEITIMTKEDAEDLITFIEMLLKFIYEFPEKVRKKKTK